MPTAIYWDQRRSALARIYQFLMSFVVADPP